MPFILVRIDKSDHAVVEWPTTCGSFATGALAAKEAARLSAIDGCRYQPRAVPEKHDWRKQLQDRIAAFPETKRMPEAWNLTFPVDHFPSRLNGYVEYTASVKDGERERRTQVRPGRYLKEFFPELTEAERSRFIVAFDTTCVVQFARSAEDVRLVYADGPDSCMKGDKGVLEDHYGNLIHAVDLYAGPDLAVGYLKDDDGCITARAVCWPDRKQYGRLYGDLDRLIQAFQAIGFSHADHFIGAVVTPAPARYDDLDVVALPYLDNIAGFHFADDGTVVTDDGSIENRKDKYRLCYYDENSNIDIYIKKQRCFMTGQYYDLDALISVAGFDQPMSEEGRDMLRQCCVTGRLMRPDDMVSTPMSFPVRWYSPEAAETHTAVCLFGGYRYPLTSMFKVEGGYVANRHTKDWARRQERRFREQQRRADITESNPTL